MGLIDDVDWGKRHWDCRTIGVFGWTRHLAADDAEIAETKIRGDVLTRTTGPEFSLLITTVFQ